jgi:hypothetical protein
MPAVAEAPSFTYRQRTHTLGDQAALVAALHTDGFALIPGALSADEIHATRAALDRLQHFGFDGQWNGGRKHHFKCVFNRERLWLEYADRAGVIELAEALMGDQCHLIGMSAWKTFPGGEGPAYVHTDKLWLPLLPESVWQDPNFVLPPHICTAHYYLQDQTIDLCPTYVIPGSHRAGRSPGPSETTWNGRSTEPVLCKAGDLLFFRSEIWHGGSPNTSEHTRYLLQVHYAHRDVAQKFSPWPFHLNPEILAVATPRQRRLLGDHPESAYG